MGAGRESRGDATLRAPGVEGPRGCGARWGRGCGVRARGCFSDCILKLGENMATYEEADGKTNGLTCGVSPGCRYWDEFHTCALTALWECQKEAAAVWEMLRRESRKIKFQGSLFDLCSPSTAQSFAWIHVPNVSILGIPLLVTWLNLETAAL
uniref:Neuritin-like protein n=2 Tax=Strigidae TaxID=30459 RepID=A0A8D0EPW6_STROC